MLFIHSYYLMPSLTCLNGSFGWWLPGFTCLFDMNRRIKIVHHFRFLFIKIKISYYITVKLVLLIEIKKKFYTIVYNKISKYNRTINKSYEWIDLLILSNTQMNGPPNIISRELFPRRALIFFIYSHQMWSAHTLGFILIE